MIDVKKHKYGFDLHYINEEVEGNLNIKFLQ